MHEPLAVLARRVETDPYFLGYALAQYAKTEELSDEDLARVLGCDIASLTRLRLCRRPRREPALFRQDVGRIASTFKIDDERLGEAVRRADALDALKTALAEHGFLMAARDRDGGDEPPSLDQSQEG